MSLAGVVRRINRRTGLVAIEIEPRDFVIVEVIDHLDHVDLGDVLTGDLGQHDYARLRNMTKGFDLRARIDAIGTAAAERDTLMRR